MTTFIAFSFPNSILGTFLFVKLCFSVLKCQMRMCVDQKCCVQFSAPRSVALSVKFRQHALVERDSVESRHTHELTAGSHASFLQ